MAILLLTRPRDAVSDIQDFWRPIDDDGAGVLRMRRANQKGAVLDRHCTFPIVNYYSWKPLENFASAQNTALTRRRPGETLAQAGATLCLVLGAMASAWPQPAVVGVALAAVVGIFVIDGLVARPLAAWNPRAALRATAWLVRLARGVLWPVVVPLQ